MAHNRTDASLRLAGIPTESVEETNHKLALRSASVRTHVAMVAELRALQAAARTSGGAVDWQAVLDKIGECRNYILAHRQLHPNVLQHMDDYDLYHMEAVDGLRQGGR